MKALYSAFLGGVTEWPNVLVLKTGDGQPSGGSNPPVSAENFFEVFFALQVAEPDEGVI